MPSKRRRAVLRGRTQQGSSHMGGFVVCATLLPMQTLTIFTDGGARGNPGPAAIGAVLYDADEQELGTVSEYLGEATNNVAEYTAIVRALEHAATVVDDTKAYQVTLKLDSQLAQRQLIGEYKVKDQTLKGYYDQVKALEPEFASIDYVHVPRAENKVADKLVNDALDRTPIT